MPFITRAATCRHLFLYTKQLTFRHRRPLYDAVCLAAACTGMHGGVAITRITCVCLVYACYASRLTPLYARTAVDDTEAITVITPGTNVHVHTPRPSDFLL